MRIRQPLKKTPSLINPHSLAQHCRCDAHYHSGGHSPSESHSVLNGTAPDDWPAVLKLAAETSYTLPAVGLHPWRVHEAPRDWQSRFQEAFEQGARAVGEIGLDGHFAQASFESQREAFTWQLNQAVNRNLPVSIHCLKATDPLLHLLRQNSRPARGIHLHAYSGSAEEVAQFVELGAYFSFHASQLNPPARKAPAALRRIPQDRLLIESDAPDTLPKSMSRCQYLATAYARAAHICDIPLPKLTEQVMTNFQRYFLDD